LVLDFHQVTRQFEFRGVNIYTQDALNSAQAQEYEGDHAYYVFQWLFQGFLLCQLLYIFLQWLIVRRKEYLYYLGYLSIIFLYFLSKYETFLGLNGPFSQWPMLKVYLAKTLLIFPYFLYLRFIRSFLEIPRHWPVLNRWLKWMEYYLLAYTTVDLILIITTGNVRLQTELYTLTLLAFFILTTWSSVYLFLHRQTLIYYILGGSFALAVGSILGQVLTYLIFYRHVNLPVDHILFYPQLGILVEILCFTAGLGHKNQIAEKEKLLSQQRLIDQRNKIAQDLHDDIGSTLSSISILSELAIHEGTIQAVHEIKDSAILLMERMDDIVWSINPRNDSLDNLLMRVRNFATTLFEARGLDYNIDIQKDLDQVKLPMDYRQHIYMILKEAINNLVKYSGAAQASIRVSREAETLTLSVRDNGRGFDTDKPRTGNGIPGMKRRADAMGATIEVQSKPGAGTTIIIQMNIR
jgi:signal transduction histidine kinase